ncbi:hypothetical protein [Gelidibacter maritimus]|uniref:Uncharacterized protein n=1 Tax=Gelidibacter maritimus TaxID=2761487 RepID=A0A7W2M3L1_9FLAO|nr:hypothetical protein [Gelidibacter maritimus]MBA6152062.1 hypothetical protein [Gelidibacter maritimus]
MKALFPLIFTLLICSSCLESQSQDARSGSKSDLGFFESSAQKHYFVDGKTGLVVYQKEFPSDWEVMSRPIYNLDNDFPSFLYLMQNKNGMKAFNTPMQQFVAFQNPYYAQAMRGYGVTNERPLISPAGFVEQELKALMGREGFKFLSHREFPELTAYVQQHVAKLGLKNVEYTVYPTEWINDDNVKALVFFSQLILHTDPALIGGEVMAIWNYQLNFFLAPTDHYETDLKIAMNADFNKVDNPYWEKYQIQVNNYRQQQKNILHQRRMRDFNNARDANHARFLDNIRGTNAPPAYASNSSHSNFIDMIREEQNVNLNGKTFKVNAGAENYWMNSDGKYIATSDQFYNPNQDPLYDNQQWDLATKH